MLPTYKGILVKDRIEWQGESPARDEPVEVYVTVLEPPSLSERRGPAMADALQEIADRGGLADIPDPVAWQREIRADRPIPGRGD